MISGKKNVLVVLLAGVMALSMVACGGKSPAPASSPAAASSSQSKDTAKSKYPEKPITIMVPSGAGGGLDVFGRSAAKVLDKLKMVNQPMTVENKPGGGQVVGIVEFANKHAKNDYELLFASTPLVLNYVKKDGNSPVGYKDLTPLAAMQADYEVIAVSADSKYKDLKSLMDDLKADPSKVIFAGGSAPGSIDHLNIIVATNKIGIDPKKVKFTSYDGGGQALTALLGGNAHALSSDLSGTLEYVRAGKVRILGVSSPVRITNANAKDIPTYKEQGVDVELLNWRGVFGGKGISGDAKKFWQEKLKALSDSPEWKAELDAQGIANAYMSADDFTKYLEKQEIMYKEIYTQLGMQK